MIEYAIKHKYVVFTGVQMVTINQVCLWLVMFFITIHFISYSDTVSKTRRAQTHRAGNVHSLMSSGARLDVVLDPYIPWGVSVGAWPVGVSSLPVNVASAARNKTATSTLTPDAAPLLANQPVRAAGAKPQEDRGLCGLGGDLGKGEALWFSI